jgi:xanthine dehydrogenase accessory factor
MVVHEDGVIGTLGGGHVEFQAIQMAREYAGHSKRFALGPSLGQCCGGIMDLSFEHIDSDQFRLLQAAKNKAFQPVTLFGGGHVGRAIIHLLSTLPYRMTWIDSRDEIFPHDLTDQIICEHSDPIESAVPFMESNSTVLIMSFSHAEDLEIVHQCLKRQRERQDLAFIGLIGSKTKWATFQNRLRERGFTNRELAGVTCPIGIPHILGKEPEVIAVAVAAQLLMHSAKPVSPAASAQ